MAKLILKSDMPAFFEKLNGFDLYGPVNVDGTSLFKKLALGETLELSGFENSKKPPKDLLFPQTEKMLDFVKKGNRFVDATDAGLPEKPRVAFGIRPCDAHSLTILDPLFSWDYTDKYYVNRRENMTLVGLSCTSENMPLKSCFCTSVGGGPASTKGLDLLLTDLGESFYVESLTPKGEKLVELGCDLFKDAGSDNDGVVADLKEKAARRISRKVEIEGISEVLEGTFESPYWEEFSKRCLGCGICTLLCPTCHCFDISDVIERGEGRRERTWDSCQYEYYTIHASGHNPRPLKKHRQRNRILHKFHYMKKNLDVTGCVGCGRCISDCPVNIDIIEVIEGVKGTGGEK